MKGLDGLRAIAILLVVVHHSHFLTQDGILYFVSKLSASGVDLFFIVSGFLITNILLNAKGKKAFFKFFYLRRILRIVPLYYALLLVAFYVVPQLNFPGIEKFKNTLEWPYWLFLSNFYIASKGQFNNGLVDLSWSLSVEEQFYIFWSICVYFFDVKKLQKLAIAIIILCPLLRLFMTVQGVNYVAIHVMSFTRMDTLMFGSLMALYPRFRSISSEFFYGTFFISLLLVISSFYFPAPFKIAFLYTFQGLLFASIVGLIIKINFESKSKFESILLSILEWKYLALIGIYSYGIYLFHNPIQKGLRGVFVYFFQESKWNIYSQQFLFYGLVTIVSCVFASLSYHLYETQWLKLKEKNT